MLWQSGHFRVVSKAERVPPAGQHEASCHPSVVPQGLIIQGGLLDGVTVTTAVGCRADGGNLTPRLLDGYGPHTNNIRIGPYLVDIEYAYAAARQLAYAVADAAWQIDAHEDQSSSIQEESEAPNTVS